MAVLAYHRQYSVGLSGVCALAAVRPTAAFPPIAQNAPNMVAAIEERTKWRLFSRHACLDDTSEAGRAERDLRLAIAYESLVESKGKVDNVISLCLPRLAARLHAALILAGNFSP